jgi:DNA (cytosine-5)-methyltransferase 1
MASALLNRYGDPQKRNRVFVTACKPDLALHDFPRETHHKDDLSLSRLVTATNALGGISRVDPTEGNGFAELVLHDGSSVFIQNHCKDGTNKQADLEELKPHEPAHTVRRKANIKHYEHDRTLTVREMALLQSFGYDFQFCGSQKQQVDGIGNAVPIKVAKAVALAIKDMYNV